MTYKKYHLGLWWIKRDLRLFDNPALYEALSQAEQVLPLFVIEPDWLKAEDSSSFHVHAVLQGLEALRLELRERGSTLVVMRGRVTDVLMRLYGQHPFEVLISHQETGVDRTGSRNREVSNWCQNWGVEWLQPLQTAVFANSDRFQRESRWRQWMAEPLLPVPDKIPTPSTLLEQDLPTLSELGLWLPAGAQPQMVSEQMGRRSLNTFLDSRSQDYAESIDSPSSAAEHGSRLSVHLAWGTISPRVVWQASSRRLLALKQASTEDVTALNWRKSIEAFRSRLHWRDHFIQRLASEPEMEFRAMHPAYRYLPLEQRFAHRFLQAWSTGQTGYPLVDAAMRCLNATGFVNFQMRAMLVSFACHVLHLDWRSIHPHLARVFRDYEPGIHFSQLQMQAGVSGINALRVYSPLRQLITQDPQLRFVHSWVPELQGATLAGLTLGRCEDYDYPAPIVEFGPRARQTLEQIYAIKRDQQRSSATLEVVGKHADRRVKRIPEAG